MIQLAAAIGGGAFVLACLVLGVRLMHLWTRTRELPEACIGLGLFLMGGLGYPLMMFARYANSLPDGTRTAIVVVYMTCSMVGNIAVCIFNWRVFRPESRFAQGLCYSVALALVGLYVAQAISPGFLAVALGTPGPWSHVNIASSFAYGWAGFESARYYFMLRKRQRIGLADPLVTDRFKLWAIGTLSAVMISAVSLTFKAMGLDFQGSVAGGLTIGTLGLLIAVCFWLAFLPPTWYLERVGRRARAVG